MGRISYIDTAKLIAILLVVFVHSDAHATVVSSFFFQFNVPLFFVLFGVLAKGKTLTWGRLDSLVRSLIVPFFILAFLLGDKPNTPEVFYDILYGTSNSLGRSSAAHLWFLPCYFCSVLMYYGAERIRLSSKWGGVFPLLLFAMMAFCIFFSSGTLNPTLAFRKVLPWSMNVSVAGVLMIYEGRILSFLLTRLKRELPRMMWLCMAILLSGIGITTALPAINDGYFVSMSTADYGFFPLYLFRIFIMGAAVLCVSKAIDCKVFSSAGRYTLLVYGIHIVIMGFYSAIAKVFFVDGVILSCMFSGLVKSLLTVATCVLLVPLFKKYLPQIVGVRFSIQDQ